MFVGRIMFLFVWWGVNVFVRIMDVNVFVRIMDVNVLVRVMGVNVFCSCNGR